MTKTDKKLRKSKRALISAVSILGIFITIFYFLIYGPRSIKLLRNKYKKAKSYADESSEIILGATVFFGDSITELCDLEKYYPYVNTCNRGISGDTTEGMLNRVESNVLAISPSNVVLLGGTNDIGKNVALQDIVNNIEQIIQRIQLSIPSCNIYIQSVYPINPKKKSKLYNKCGSRTNIAIDDLNILLNDLCAQYGCVYIDVNSQLKDKDGNLKKQYTFDGLHLTKKGYKVASKIIAPYLENTVYI